MHPYAWMFKLPHFTGVKYNTIISNINLVWMVPDWSMSPLLLFCRDIIHWLLANYLSEDRPPTNSYFPPYGQHNSCFGEQENVGILVSNCTSFPFLCNGGSALFPFSITRSFSISVSFVDNVKKSHNSPNPCQKKKEKISNFCVLSSERNRRKYCITTQT